MRVLVLPANPVRHEMRPLVTPMQPVEMRTPSTFIHPRGGLRVTEEAVVLPVKIMPNIRMFLGQKCSSPFNLKAHKPSRRHVLLVAMDVNTHVCMHVGHLGEF